LYSEFCCNVDWDAFCAEQAMILCGLDCNGNGVLDEQDISEGTSLDVNLNGTPDECDPGACCNRNTGVCADIPPVRCWHEGEVATYLTSCLDTPCEIGPIPATSEWALLIAFLLALAIGSIAFRRGTPPQMRSLPADLPSQQ